MRNLANWARSHGLQFSVNKCFYTVFPVTGNITRRPTIKLAGENIKYVREIKYLGLLFDVGLTWFPHLNRVLERVVNFEYRLKQICRATWGLRPMVVKTIYLRATEKMTLYGGINWYKGTVRMTTKLAQIQRRSLIGVTKCYNTVSNETLQVLSGCIPLDLVIDSDSY